MQKAILLTIALLPLWLSSQVLSDSALGLTCRQTFVISLLSDVATVIVAQPDGKILLGGYTTSPIDGASAGVALARCHNSGVLDSSFNGTGIFTAFYDSVSSVSDIKLQPDGKILVSGRVFNGVNNDALLLRLLPNGTPDSSFGTYGVVKTDVAGGEQATTKIALQADGKILLGGKTDSAGTIDMLLLRYHANGVPDSSFAANGVFTADYQNKPNRVVGLAVQSNGYILALADEDDYLVGAGTIFRFNASGQTDSTFATNGILPVPNMSPANALALQPDGKILTSGSVPFLIGMSAFGVYRYLPNGTLDNSFGTNGLARYQPDNGPQYSLQPTTLFVEADSQIVVAGKLEVAGSYGLGVIRLTPNGVTDNNFSGNGKFYRSDFWVQNIAEVSPDNYVLVGYKSYTPFNSSDNFIISRCTNCNTTTPALSSAATLCTGDTLTLCAPAGALIYAWNNGTTTACQQVTQGNTYQATLTDVYTCQHISDTLTITENSLPTPVISYGDYVLTTGLFTTYQWQLDGDTIQGANNDTLIATGPGAYTVLVSDSNGCTGLSAPFVVSAVTEPASSSFALYPNPSAGQVYIKGLPGTGNTTLYVTNATGQVVYTQTVSTTAATIHLHHLPAGVYGLRVSTGSETYCRKLLLQHP